MTADHTPGPWRRQIIAPTFEHTSIETANGKLAIARVYSRGANARLIAAAPELLEACKLIVSVFDALPPTSAARTERLQINAARAAIAKATGETT